MGPVSAVAVPRQSIYNPRRSTYALTPLPHAYSFAGLVILVGFSDMADALIGVLASAMKDVQNTRYSECKHLQVMLRVYCRSSGTYFPDSVSSSVIIVYDYRKSTISLSLYKHWIVWSSIDSESGGRRAPSDTFWQDSGWCMLPLQIEYIWVS